MQARKSLGMTQLEVADAAGVSRQLVNRLEVGTATGIALDKLLSILAVVGCTMDVSTDAVMSAEDDEAAPQAAWRQQLGVDPSDLCPLDETLFMPDGGE